MDGLPQSNSEKRGHIHREEGEKRHRAIWERLKSRSNYQKRLLPETAHVQERTMEKTAFPLRSPRKWKKWKPGSKEIFEIVNQGHLPSKHFTLAHIAPLWLIHVLPEELVWEGKWFLRPSKALKWICISDKKKQLHFQSCGSYLKFFPSLLYDGLLQCNSETLSQQRKKAKPFEEGEASAQ